MWIRQNGRKKKERRRLRKTRTRVLCRRQSMRSGGLPFALFLSFLLSIFLAVPRSSYLFLSLFVCCFSFRGRRKSAEFLLTLPLFRNFGQLERVERELGKRFCMTVALITPILHFYITLAALICNTAYPRQTVFKIASAHIFMLHPIVIHWFTISYTH